MKVILDNKNFRLILDDIRGEQVYLIDKLGEKQVVKLILNYNT